jgi:hypothetical protein
MKRTGGLGLELLEYDAAEKGNLGLVLVGGVVPGSNAAACGGFVVGDTLVELTIDRTQDKVLLDSLA